MYLVIDECCGKKLKPLAEDQGHSAQRSIEVAQLGQGASDADIFAFAAASGAVLVTINQGDFRALSMQVDPRPGLVLLPSLRGAELAKLFKTVLPALTAVFDGAQDAIVQVAEDRTLRRLA
jgi:predicted nuclease of predicted toxin-antitoxin system